MKTFFLVLYFGNFFFVLHIIYLFGGTEIDILNWVFLFDSLDLVEFKLLGVISMDPPTTTTCSSNAITTESLPVTSTAAPIANGVTTHSINLENSLMGMSFTPHDQNNNGVSPEYCSFAAQLREVPDGSQSVRGASNTNNILRMVNATIGLSQAQLMLDVDRRIQQAVDEIKQALNTQATAPIQEESPESVENLTGSQNSLTNQLNAFNQRTETTQSLGFQQLTYSQAHMSSQGCTHRQTSNYVQPAAGQMSTGLPQLPPLTPATNFVFPLTSTAAATQSVHLSTDQHQLQQPLTPIEQQPLQQQYLQSWQQQYQPPLQQQYQQPYEQSQLPRNPQSVHQQVNQLYNQNQMYQSQQVQPQMQQQHVYGNQPPIILQPESSRQRQEVWTAPSLPPQQNQNFSIRMPRQSFEPLSRKLEKWNLRFDGTNRTMNVQEFIFRVGVLKQDYNCTDEEILRDFHILLEGPARDWYWDHRKLVRVQTWSDLEKALLTKYRRFEKEYQVQMQILNRRQLPQESFEEFYNAVMKLRNQQDSPYEEGQLVEIMRGNLKPSLAQIMFSVQVRTLLDFCREVKRAESLLANQRQVYQQRPNTNHRVSELAYEEAEETPLVDFEVNGIRSTSHYTCWNCKVVGHSFVDCPEPLTRQFCFRCGRDGVVTPKCPKCQGNRLRSPSRTGEMRSTEV